MDNNNCDNMNKCTIFKKSYFKKLFTFLAAFKNEHILPV